MKKISKYENKKVLVLGLAKSGVSAAKLLHELGALVTVNDGKPFDENPEAQELLSLGTPNSCNNLAALTPLFASPKTSTFLFSYVDIFFISCHLLPNDP